MSRRTLTPTNEDVSLLLVPPLCDDVSCLMMLAMTLLTLAVSQLRIVVSLFAVCSATGYCWLRDPKSAVCFRCVRGPFNLAFGASAFLSCCYLWISSSSFVYKYQVSLSSISSTLIQVAVINRVVSSSTAIEGRIPALPTRPPLQRGGRLVLDFSIGCMRYWMLLSVRVNLWCWSCPHVRHFRDQSPSSFLN